MKMMDWNATLWLQERCLYLIQIPVLYNIHPVTKTDWEGKGVQPDILADKDDAQTVAQLHALEILIEEAEKKNYQTILKRYAKIKVELGKRW